MFMALIFAFVLGLVAGLRSLTASAALFLARGGMIAIALAALIVTR